MAQSNKSKTPVKSKAKAKAKSAKAPKKIKRLVRKVMIGYDLYTPEGGTLPPESEHADLIARGFIIEGDEDPVDELESNTTVIVKLDEDAHIELGTVVKNDQELAKAMKIVDKVEDTQTLDLKSVVKSDKK